MNKSGAASHIPTVSRLLDDTIVELVYEPDKRKTALVVSRFGGLWNIERELQIGNGEILVPYSAGNSLIANACVRLPSRPEHHGDKRMLLDAIISFLHRYADMEPLFEKVAAHYVLLSWVFDAFNDVPYLRVRGEFGTGKTRMLLTIGSLCYKPFFASGASTTSPLFHTLDAFGGTLVLDEGDFRFSDRTADLVKILNNGTTRGLPVLRTMQNRNKEFNPQAFKVFGPKLVGMRGHFEDPALESRFLTAETGTTALREDIAIHLPPDFEAKAQDLRNQLLHFRLCNRLSISPSLDAVPSTLPPRVRQMALPLLTLVDEQALRSEIVAWLRDQSDRAVVQSAQSFAARLVAALSDAFAQENVTSVPLGEIARKLDDDGSDATSNRAIGSTLRTQFDIRTKKSHGVFVVPVSEKAKIDVAVARFRQQAARVPTDATTKTSRTG